MVAMSQGAHDTSAQTGMHMFRELDQRRCAGLIVTLEWDPDSDQVQVRCEDEHTPAGPPLRYPIEPGAARSAFLHPFAFQPREGTKFNGAVQQAESSETTGHRRRRWYRLWSKPTRSSVTGASDLPWPWLLL
jgi:hypothetical protein